MNSDNKWSEREDFLKILETRFARNVKRHPAIEWSEVLKRLESHEEKLGTLFEMERTGGEPDVVAFDEKTGEYVFFDCSPESPAGRRSLCYDRASWESRKENRPKGSALGMAEEMGIEILTEAQYRKLQELGEFDLKTSSWVATPSEVRKLGGALFCDRRYGTVFTYHNGAESYYAARGFRGVIRI